ncbi:MAG: hydantoinase/oxoprolinase family protein [Myxococcota bacterium]
MPSLARWASSHAARRRSPTPISHRCSEDTCGVSRRHCPGPSCASWQSSGGLTTPPRAFAVRMRCLGRRAASSPHATCRATRRTRPGDRLRHGRDLDRRVALVEGSARSRLRERGGVRVKAPMLRIHTVAAGGGSLCRFDGIRLVVGPESAGSDPGPLCYGLRGRRGSPACGDARRDRREPALGRVAPRPLSSSRSSLAPVERALDELVERLSRAGFARTRDEVAAGFFEIANANMAQAIQARCRSRGRRSP